MISIKVKVKEGYFDEVEKKIKRALGKGLRQITEAAYKEWQAEAGRKLNSTRRAYQDALKMVIVGDNEAKIELSPKDKSTKWLVRALEMGWPAFDLKPGRLGKSNRPAYYWSEHTKPDPKGSTKGPGAKKEPGQPWYQQVPFVDIPFWPKGSKEGAEPEKFRRMHKGGAAWKHPGFKPKGGKGPGPMRPHVVEFIKEQAQKIFQKEIDSEFARGTG